MGEVKFIETKWVLEPEQVAWANTLKKRFFEEKPGIKILQHKPTGLPCFILTDENHLTNFHGVDCYICFFNQQQASKAFNSPLTFDREDSATRRAKLKDRTEVLVQLKGDFYNIQLIVPIHLLQLNEYWHDIPANHQSN